jgi:anti-anti-sigma factor
VDYFEKYTAGDVVIEKIKLSRATLMEAGTMKARLLENINLKQNKIILDISECIFIDSTFYGALAFSLKKIREIGGDIKLVTPAFSIGTEGILNISNVQNIFDVYTSVEDALQAYS